MLNPPKYTPGPWQRLPEEVDKPYIRIRGTQLGGRYKVANVMTPVYDDVHPREAEETRANAALIAAAPEMLAALIACADWIAAGPDGARVLAQLRRAVAKAQSV